MFVKLCGMRDIEAAQVAVDAGANALGFILAPSKRQVSPETIAEIRSGLSGEVPALVGVTVNATADELRSLVERSGIDMIQLSGAETPELLEDLPVPAIKAFRFPTGTLAADALAEVETWLAHANPPAYVLLEGHAPGAFGGTGTQADWGLAREVALRFPVLLAGGLDPDNVADAIREVGPFGVDVSSGTETDGTKDPEKIRSFIRRARSVPQSSVLEA